MTCYVHAFKKVTLNIVYLSCQLDMLQRLPVRYCIVHTVEYWLLEGDLQQFIAVYSFFFQLMLHPQTFHCTLDLSGRQSRSP